jgi:hypothetical protein
MGSFVRSGTILAAVLVAACNTPVPTEDAPALAAERAGSGGDELAFGPRAHPFGRSMPQWTATWWRWEMSIPAAVNPGLDATGEHCGEGQRGNVWFLATVFAPGSVTRTCTMPPHRAVLVTLSSLLNDYPCPDPNFHPAPGQSLEGFLAQGAAAVENGVNQLNLSVDGQPVPDLFAHRTSTGLFHFTGDPSLATALDPCVTGQRQVAVADGYLVMLKPLSRGHHTVRLGASDVNGFQSDVTYNLTVRGGD